MILNSTSDILRLRLDQAVTTNELAWVTSYNDHAATTFTPADEDGASNGTSNVTIVSSPAASTQRQVTTINVFNRDTVSQNVIIEKFDGTNARLMCTCTLAPSDTLYWSREKGWIVRKGIENLESYILREYISNGTWTKPAGLKMAIIVAVGAGGGGGSGRRGAAGTNRFGGGGGGGGAAVWMQIPADHLNDTVSIVIGTGGTGGVSQTVDTSNGNPGTSGGDTTVGSFIVAKGGGGGVGGTTTNGQGGAAAAAANCRPPGGPFSLAGGSGGSGTAGNSSGTTGTGFGGSLAGPGGMGGFGFDTTGATISAPQSNNGTNVNGVAQGIIPPSNSINGFNDILCSLFWNYSISGQYGVGTAGTPGGAGTGIASGNGGRCSGGCGGSGSTNGTNSGAGGNGGDGLVHILEIY